ncbi:MAG TPA: peptide chain release factor N(5)-glutamine methyltransferase [Candidatus Nanopelagicaceae bacterium]
MIVREALKNAKRALRDSDYEEVDAEHLLAHLLGISRMDLHNSVRVESALAQFEEPDELQEMYDQLIARRIANEPIQYITGLAYFCDLTLQVGPGVLIPRPESELMIDRLIAHLKRFTSAASVIDLGAGAGSLALAIATQSAIARVIAVEMDPGAVYWLRKNIEAVGAEVRVVAEDVETALPGVKADLIIANPPYVPDAEVLPAEVQDFEPHVALFGGPDGMDIPRRFFTAAARLLKSNGLFVTEHGEEQGDLVAAALAADFHDVTLHLDLNQRPRWTSALRN